MTYRENAEEHGAMLVFAEHRYYGKSFPTKVKDTLKYLSHEQALADYAKLLLDIKAEYGIMANESVTISFGGSYGGKLSAWFRLKYPHMYVHKNIHIIHIHIIPYTYTYTNTYTK